MKHQTNNDGAVVAKFLIVFGVVIISAFLIGLARNVDTLNIPICGHGCDQTNTQTNTRYVCVSSGDCGNMQTHTQPDGVVMALSDCDSCVHGVAWFPIVEQAVNE